MNVQQPTTFTRFLKTADYISKVIDIYLNDEHLFSIATYSMTALPDKTAYSSFHTYRNTEEGAGQGLVGFFENFDLIQVDDTQGTIGNFKFYKLDYTFTFFKSSILNLIETIVNSDDDRIPYAANKFNIIYPANNMAGIYKSGNAQDKKCFLFNERVVINNGSIIGLYFPNKNVKDNALTSRGNQNKNMMNFFKNKKHTTAITLLCQTFGMENCTTFDTFFYNLNNNEEYKRRYSSFADSEPKIKLTYSEPFEMPLITRLNGVSNLNPTQQVVLNYLKEVIETVPGDYTRFNKSFAKTMDRIQTLSLNKHPAEIIEFLQKINFIPRETNLAASIFQDRKRNGDEEEESVVNGKRPAERDEPEDKNTKRGGMRNTKHKKRNTKHKRRNTKHKKRNTKHKKRNTTTIRNTKHKKY
jgi:hypothetical protein